MNIATMKVHGDADGLEDVRDGLPTEPDSMWEKGDVRPDGRVRIDSGFYVSIGTDKDPLALLKTIRHYLAECQARGIHFERSDISAELRVAITAPDGGAAPSFDFEISDLKLLVEMGISLSIIP